MENKDKKPTSAASGKAEPAADKKKATQTKKNPFKKPTAKKPEEKKPEAKKATETKAKQSASDKKKRSLFNTKYLSGLLFSKMAKGGTEQLSTHADEVNQLNVFPVPDGDTGDNMRMTIESGLAEVEKIDSDDLSDVMKALSHGMLLGARGNSGVILSQFFAGIAKELESAPKADAAALGAALEVGVAQAYASVMTPTEGTILTVAREGVEFATSRITSKSTIPMFFSDLVKGMQDSLERTPEMLTALKEANVVDSGGAGLFYIIDGFNRVLNGEEVGKKKKGQKKTDRPASMPSPVVFAFGPDSKMSYGYCTELLLQLQHCKTNIDAFNIDDVKAFLGEIGDSIVAFKTDSIVKIHVHTFTPDKVLSYCLQYGEFLTVKIENMSVQHTETATEEETPKKADEPKKKYGIVAVTNGPGLEALFKEFGTDEIVEGGQTQNPSTNDFLDAFAKVNAEHIFVFPNNGNILLAAQQAAELYKDAAIHVIPSKNIGTGYVALSSMNLESDDPEAICEEANEAMKRVTAGHVSPAIRDADMNGVHVTNGDTIGIVNKEIVVSNADRITATLALVDKLLGDGDKFMLTAFTGKDANTEEQEQLQAAIAEKHPDAEVYFMEGGQDIYPYIFVAE